MDEQQLIESNPRPEPTRSARSIHQSFLEQLGDRTWDEYRDDNIFLIKQKIGYSLFGPPSQGSDLENSNNDSTFGYTEEQLEIIDPLYEKILTFRKYSPNKSSICMSVVFVCCVPQVPQIKNIHLMDNIEHPEIQVVPVFRIRKCIKMNHTADGILGCSFFVDHIGRVYKNWEHYMKKNELGKGIIVAPQNGYYTGFPIGEDFHVQLQIEWSPASGIGAKIRNAAEIASTVVAVGTVGVMATAAFVPVGAAVGAATLAASAATGVYGVASSTQRLHDRSTHGQEIGLTNPQARGCWINIGASTVGMVASASSRLLSKAVGNGVTVSKGFIVAHDTACIASLIISGTGIANSVVNLHTQWKKTKKAPSNFELFQLASSLLFFTNSLVSNKMARTIIEETQTSTIASYRDTLSNKQRKMFDKMSGETRRLEGMQNGNTVIIRSTKIIQNKNEFFRDAARINKDLNQNGVRISFNKDGQALLNGQHIVDPREFHSMSSDARVDYLTSVGRADLNVPNAPARLVAQPVNAMDLQSVPVGTIITCVIKASQLMESLPDIAGNDEVLLQYIANKITTFANDIYIYNNFISLINWLKSQVFSDPYINDQLAVMGIDGTNLFFRLFQTCYDYLIKFIGAESEIAEALEFFYRNGRLEENRVRGVLTYFRERLNDDYQVFQSSEIRCGVCNGITFSKD